MPNTSGRWALPYIAGGDPANTIDNVMQALAEKLRDEGAQFDQGTLASIPAAGKSGRLYYATDRNLLFYDNGSAWAALKPNTGPLLDVAVPSGVAGNANQTVNLLLGQGFTVAASATFVRVRARLLLVEFGASGITAIAVTGQMQIDGGAWVTSDEGTLGGSVGPGYEAFYEEWTWTVGPLTAGAHTIGLRFLVGNVPITVGTFGRGRLVVEQV